MVPRPTKGSADLTRREIKEGSAVLLEKLQTYRPKVAVFNGKLIYEVFSGKKDFCFGKQPDTVAGTNTVSMAVRWRRRWRWRGQTAPSDPSMPVAVHVGDAVVVGALRAAAARRRQGALLRRAQEVPRLPQRAGGPRGGGRAGLPRQHGAAPARGDGDPQVPAPAQVPPARGVSGQRSCREKPSEPPGTSAGEVSLTFGAIDWSKSSIRSIHLRRTSRIC